MERFKSVIKRICCVHWAVALVLTALAAAGLVWVFGLGNEMSPLSYGCYVLAFYALVVDCVSLFPKLVRWGKTKKEANRTKTAAEKETDFRRGLYQSLAIKTVYAAANLIAGTVQRSVWLQSMGLYYLVLAMVWAVLGVYEHRLGRLTDQKARHRLGWSGFQVCGVLLLVLHLTTTGVIFQIIRNGREASGEIMVIANAAYTFYQVITASIDVAQYRKNPNPIWGASRNLRLTEALMSLFFLQASMLTVFGGEARFRYLMNSLTGDAVCVMAVFGAIGMIVHGKKRKQQGAMDDGT